jgi:phosphoglycolate phosphatase-like HAD superfamily hydrolase
MSNFIVFDIDGVLIQTNGSFVESTIKTFEFVRAMFNKPAKCNIDHISFLKSLGGFNNDWDLTFALLSISWDYERFDDKELLAILKNYFKKDSILPKIEITFDFVKRIFQEYYLGEKLFFDMYGEMPKFVFFKGFIYQEKPVINFCNYSLNIENIGIYSGRCFKEAEVALRAVNLMPLKEFYFTDDSGFKKPDPTPLEKMFIINNCSKMIYVGDTLDDLELVKRAREKDLPVEFIGVETGTYSSQLFESLKNLSFAKMFQNVREYLDNNIT